MLSELARARPDERLEAWFARFEPSSALPSVVLDELTYGRARLPEGHEAADRLDGFLGDLRDAFAGRILAFDGAVAERCGELRGLADRAGRTIERAEAMIATTALSRRAALANRNTRHFAGIERLKLIDPWTD